MTRIVLNAQLLASGEGFRAAGIHNYIHHLLQHLPTVREDDWQLHAYVGARNQRTYPGIHLHRAGWNTEVPWRRIIWEQVAYPLHLRGADLHHAMAFASPLLDRTPTVVTVYDLTFMRYPERLSRSRRMYLRSLTQRTCREARRILAISASTADDLVNLLHIPRDKIDVTPLGYDRSRFRLLPAEQVAAFRVEKQLPPTFWLFLGTLEPRKNLPILLEAYASLSPAERRPLILAGGRGWQTDSIDAVIERYQLHDDVRFVGFVPADEIPLWYNCAALFVYPSVFEGFGLPVLEAMACGTPVITTNVSSLPEVASDAGLTLPPDDPAAWAEALRRAGQDQDWQAQAQQAGLARAQQFRWEETAALTVASYRRALHD